METSIKWYKKTKPCGPATALVVMSAWTSLTNAFDILWLFQIHQWLFTVCICMIEYVMLEFYIRLNVDCKCFSSNFRCLFVFPYREITLIWRLLNYLFLLEQHCKENLNPLKSETKHKDLGRLNKCLTSLEYNFCRYKYIVTNISVSCFVFSPSFWGDTFLNFLKCFLSTLLFTPHPLPVPCWSGRCC